MTGQLLVAVVVVNGNNNSSSSSSSSSIDMFKLVFKRDVMEFGINYAKAKS